MDRRKLESAALFLTLLGVLLILPPLAAVFQLERRILGIPAEVIYLFVCWAGLIAGAYGLSRRLPADRASKPTAEDDA
jgi:hypothetical protein